MEAARDACDGMGCAPMHTHCRHSSGVPMGGRVSGSGNASGLQGQCARRHTHTATTRRRWAGVSAETRRSGMHSQSLTRGAVTARCIAE